jgi:hypothetical protein
MKIALLFAPLDGTRLFDRSSVWTYTFSISRFSTAQPLQVPRLKLAATTPWTL